MDSSSAGSDLASSNSQLPDIRDAGDRTDADKDQNHMSQSEQSHGKAAGLVVGPELLAEILNRKKMELLKSPEIRDVLIQQQSKLSSRAPVCEGSQNSMNDFDSDLRDPMKKDSTDMISHQIR